ncbi:MAG: serine hydrolase [Candidatus Omnitrophota bacterium]
MAVVTSYKGKRYGWVKRPLGIVVVLVALGGCSCEEPVEVSVDAKCAVIAEAGSGRVFFAKNADEKFPPASTAKVMTAVLAVENLDMDTEITPSAGALSVEPTIAGLRPGVKYRVRDLLAAVLIKSANDAAMVIAEAVAGSEKNFTAMMNRKAEEIGMKNTFFATASGLPTGKKDSQYTTARDLADMMRYAARHKAILEMMSKKDMYIYGSDGRRIYLKTHNKTLLSGGGNAPWGKTGYTREAKRTFAGIDPSLEPKIVFSLLQSDALWKDITELKDKGLAIYEKKHRNFFKDLIGRIKTKGKGSTGR